MVGGSALEYLPINVEKYVQISRMSKRMPSFLLRAARLLLWRLGRRSFPLLPRAGRKRVSRGTPLPPDNFLNINKIHYVWVENG